MILHRAAKAGMQRKARQGFGGLLVLGALVWSAPAAAATLVDSGEIDDTTWTAAGSPYLLNDDLLVPPGKVLIIEAGTTVVVGSSDLSAAGRDPNLIELRVQGELYVNGTLSAPVRIWNEDASSQDGWYGIVLEPEATHARLLYTEIANAENCLESDGAADVEVVATTFATCDTGAFFDGGIARFDRVLVHDSHYGLWLQNAADTTFSNVIARSNDMALYVMSSALTLENVTFVDNTIGLATASQHGVATSMTLANAIFANNSPQFKLGSNTTLAVAASDVWPAAPANSRLTLGDGVLSADPAFVAPPADLHLQATSPCIDAGDSGASADHDFERNARPLDGNGDGTPAPDLGAYELFHRAFCGDGHVDPAEACDDGDANGAPGFCSEDCHSRPAGTAGIAGAAAATAGAAPTGSAGGSPGLGGVSGFGGVGGSSATSGTGTGGSSGTAAGNGTAGGDGSGGMLASTSGGAGGVEDAPNTGGNAGEDTTGVAPVAGRAPNDTAGGGVTASSRGRAGAPGAGHASASAAGDGASLPHVDPSGDDRSNGADGGDAGARAEPPSSTTCTPGAKRTCACPDGSTGKLSCESDRSLVCYCAATPLAAPKPEGCGCRVPNREPPSQAWLGALAWFGLTLRRRRTRS